MLGCQQPTPIIKGITLLALGAGLLALVHPPAAPPVLVPPAFDGHRPTDSQIWSMGIASMASRSMGTYWRAISLHWIATADDAPIARLIAPTYVWHSSHVAFNTVVN